MSDLQQRYDIETDGVMFAPGEQFDVMAIGAAQSPWWNRTLCAVNDAWVRLGVLEDRMVTLKPGQPFTVPAGVLHCPHARMRSVVLMAEKAGVSPTGE